MSGAGAAILALLALAACCIRRRRSNHLRDIDPDDTDEWDGAAPDMFVKRSNSALGFTPQHGAVEHKETGMHSAVTAAPVAYNRPAARASLPSITTTPAQMMAPPQPPSVSSYHSLRDQHFAQQRPLSYVHSESAPSYRTEFGQQQQPMREAEAEHPAMAQRQSMLSLNGYNDAPPNGRPVSMTLQRAMDAAARRSVNYESCVFTCTDHTDLVPATTADRFRVYSVGPADIVFPCCTHQLHAMRFPMARLVYRAQIIASCRRDPDSLLHAPTPPVHEAPSAVLHLHHVSRAQRASSHAPSRGRSRST